MKIIYNLIKKIFKNNTIIFKEDKILLGRWNIEYCPKKINNKIDMSNFDHCGSCGLYSSYHLDKIQK